MAIFNLAMYQRRNHRFGIQFGTQSSSLLQNRETPSKENHEGDRQGRRGFLEREKSKLQIELVNIVKGFFL